MVWVLGGGAQSRLNDSGRRGLETTALEEAYQNYRFAAWASFHRSTSKLHEHSKSVFLEVLTLLICILKWPLMHPGIYPHTSWE